MSNNCEKCPLICDLRRQVREISTQLTIAPLENELLKTQYAEATRKADELEMDLTTDEVIKEELGFHVTGSVLEDYVDALDESAKAMRLLHQQGHATFMARDGGEEVIASTTKQIQATQEWCNGPKQGIRVPLTHCVIRLPFGMGKEHCGSIVADSSEIIREINKNYLPDAE